MFLTQKLKGGALYIALIISIVIGIILSVFILIAYFNQRQVLSGMALSQLQLHLNSGLSMAASENFTEAHNTKWLPLPYNNDSVRIKKLQWGCYEIICVESKNSHHYLRQSGLYGGALGSDTALVVSDRSRPIGLSGTIKLNGYCYFPKAGYKPAYIEGESFNSEGSLNSFIREAPMSLPSVKQQLAERLSTCLHSMQPATDSLIPALPEQLTVDFSCKTAVLQSSRLHLGSQHLAGNIKLVADEALIEETARLENILIVAAKVRIKKGFKGSVHILASDSIIMEDGCVLEYPSSLTLLNEPSAGKAMKGIYLGQDCIVHGALLALNANPNSSVMVKLNKGCEVYGLVYSSNYAHLQGKLFGTAFCDALLVMTPSAVYENHLLGCELDPKKFRGSVVVPAIFKNSPYKCCKWL